MSGKIHFLAEFCGIDNTFSANGTMSCASPNLVILLLSGVTESGVIGADGCITGTTGPVNVGTMTWIVGLVQQVRS